VSLFSFSCLLILIFFIPLIIFILKKVKHKNLRNIWALFCLAVSIWGAGGFGFSFLSKEDYDLALFWWQIGYIGAIFTVVFYVHFVISFLKLPYRKFLISVYSLAFIFLFFLWYDKSRYFLGDLRWVFNQFYWVDYLKYKNILWFVFYISFYWIFLSYAFLLLIKAYRENSGLRKVQLKYFILGSLIGWIGAEGLYLPAFHIDIYPYSNFLIAIYPTIFVYAIVKYRLMDIHVTITRVGIFSFLYFLLLFIPFYVVYYT